MKTSELIFVLWASRFDEVVASTFVAELRRVGLAVQVVGLHRQPVPGSFGLALTPDMTLSEALPLASNVRCLVVPGSWLQLQAFHHEPRLEALIQTIRQRGGQILVGGPPAVSEAEQPLTLTFYPPPAQLRAFAQALAHHLLTNMVQPFVPFVFEPTLTALTPQFMLYPGDFFMCNITAIGEISDQEIIRVAADSPPAAVGGAIAQQMRQRHQAEVQAIGAGAVNQMMKSAIIAQRYLAPEGHRLVFIPHFVDIEINGQERTAIRLVCRNATCSQT